MAQFSADINLDAIIPKGLQDENLALEMVKAGQEVLKNAIQSGANKHRKTGAMAASLRSTKPYIDKNGDAIGRVKFTGSDGQTTSKSGKKFDRTNWIKAFRIEYGSSKQKAEPIVRPAVKSSENSIIAALKAVFDRAVKS